MPIHEHYRTADVILAKEKALGAIADYEGAGGEIYWGFCQPPVMAVNVRLRKIDLAPELKQDDEVQNNLINWECAYFWEEVSDAYGDREIIDTKIYHFPKIYSAGRMGGHLVFNEKYVDYSNAAVSIIHKQEDIEEVVLYEWARAGDDYYYDQEIVDEIINDIIHGFECLQEFFEDATKWVEYVKICQEYHEDNLKGKYIDWLELQMENLRFELFDLKSCSAVFHQDDTVTVSWPQHERIFNDMADLTPASSRAMSESDRPTPSIFEYTLDFDDFITALTSVTSEVHD